MIMELRPIVYIRNLGGPEGKCPPWGAFIRDPSLDLREFRRKLYQQERSGTKPGISRLPILTAEPFGYR